MAVVGSLLALTGCFGGDGGEASPATPAEPAATGTVSGRVLSSRTGEPLTGAAVSALGVTAQSASDGSFTLGPVPAGSGVVGVELDGFAPMAYPVTVATGTGAQVEARLTPVAATQTYAAALGATISVSGSSAQVSLPAGGVVDAATGVAFMGDVTVELTPLDPAADPRNMPGNFTARASGSAVERIESFGALDVRLRDAAGNRLNLGAGQTATIRIPVATRSTDLPAALPLYYLDDASGLWVEEGSASLARDGSNPYYEGQVSHFTTWNADRPAESIVVQGCVQDASGARLAAASVESSGLDYSGRDAVSGTVSGDFAVSIRRGGRAMLFASLNERVSNPVPVGPSDADIVLSACLVMAAGGTPPVISEQPQSQSAIVGSGAYFKVAAFGSSPTLRYQWQRNGSAIAGATQSVLFVAPVQAGDDGAVYTVVVSNPFGTVTSEPAVLTLMTVTEPPIFVLQPADVSLLVGGSASFTAQAGVQGVEASYQWLRDGVAIAGATGASYTTPATTSADDGARFSVLATLGGLSTRSSDALLTVQAAASAPVVSQQPQSASASVGASATFTVTASGVPAPAYQWRRDGVAIVGATAASYTTPALTLADSGAAFSVVITNLAGSVTSAAATLSVSQPASGSGYYFVVPAGAPVSGSISFANGAQTVSSPALVAVNAVSPTSTAVVEPAGPRSAEFFAADEGIVAAGQVSKLRQRYTVYFKQGGLFKLDQVVGTGLPTPQRVSSLVSTEVCGTVGYADVVYETGGDDLQDASRSWYFVRGPGADGNCGTADDKTRAVRLDMNVDTPAATIDRPLVSIIDNQGAFAGLLVLAGNQVQRLDANLGNPVDLFTVGDPASLMIDPSTRFGRSAPGFWLFAESGKVWGVNLAAPASRTEIATLASGESFDSDLGVNDGANLYVPINGPAGSRLLKVSESFGVTTLATLDQPIEQLGLTPTRVVLQSSSADAATSGFRAASVLKTGGALLTLIDGPPGAIGFPTVSGENVYQTAITVDSTTLPITTRYETTFINADGSNRQSLPNTTVVATIAPASVPLFTGSEWPVDAVVFGDTGTAGSTALRAVEGSTRAAQVVYGSVPHPAAKIFQATYLSDGDPGLLFGVTGFGFELYWLDTDQPGLVRVPGVAAPSGLRGPSATPPSAPGGRATMQASVRAPSPASMRAVSGRLGSARIR